MTQKYQCCSAQEDSGKPALTLKTPEVEIYEVIVSWL